MEFKHSPAPWHLRDGVNENSLLVDDNYSVIFASLDDIKKEDADLIAAAPELLEALIELTESAKEAIDGLGDLSDAIDTAKAAISKALGQQ
ncbi:hypothetical protein [Providencia rettgeri]|uniref:hypothetical protein n=1 Tax=Providencia rettgeri TaxID=587 RepID=UPI00155F02B2|nr:hypothetical protein [Providencia rettgeri]QKG44644.1 hypothetical protein HRD55_08625 [Providencia rettgeri]QNN34777.1 hypothetical protein H9X60_08630 [Providencia rettgeri]